MRCYQEKPKASSCLCNRRDPAGQQNETGRHWLRAPAQQPCSISWALWHRDFIEIAFLDGNGTKRGRSNISQQQNQRAACLGSAAAAADHMLEAPPVQPQTVGPGQDSTSTSKKRLSTRHWMQLLLNSVCSSNQKSTCVLQHSLIACKLYHTRPYRWISSGI